MKLIQKILLLTCILELALLSACKVGLEPTPVSALVVGDGGFLSEKPCGPPCFWGITPGITNEKDAIGLLELKGVQTAECDYSQRQNPDQSEIRCGPVSTGGYTIGIASDTSGIVKNIGFGPDFPITVGDVIAKFGNPDSVSVVNLNVTVLPKDMGIQLYYDDLQAVLTLPEQEGNAVITANLGIVDILYSNTQSYEKSRKYTQSWHGYGAYSSDP